MKSNDTDRPKRYTLAERWRITGTLRTCSPLHVGSGEAMNVVEGDATKRPRTGPAHENTGKPCEIQAVVVDHDGKPCIPGTALKGVVRAWAEKFCADRGAEIERIFGDRNMDAKTAKGGCAEFLSAMMKNPRALLQHVPYGDAARQTGVLSHVCIDRATGAAEAEKLFFEEFVPAKAEFTVEIILNQGNAADIAFLLAILEQGTAHETHPMQFGANGADGWGRMEWKLTGGVVEQCDRAKVRLDDVGKDRWSKTPIVPASLKLVEPADLVMELTLAFNGPFLVNDTSKTKETDVDDGRTNLTALKRADGQVWLPASSFRGALRSRVEFLANSKDQLGVAERIFGDSQHVARLTIPEFKQVGPCESRHQDFVAIDRFTGGAADGAKFDATYADCPKFTTTLVLDHRGLTTEDEILLAAALRDVCEGRVTFGFGGAKGYGEATGTLDDAGRTWRDALLKDAPLAASDVRASASPVPAEEEGLLDGLLTIQPNNKGFIEYKLKHAGIKRADGQRLAPADCSLDLHQQLVVDLPAQFILEGNQPTRVRKQGGVFESPPAGAVKAKQDATSKPAGSFHNPYYFLRLEDRAKFSGDLADRAPVSHQQYQPGHFSGTIRVRLTTQTPLLICEDEADAEAVPTAKGEHRRYAMRVDAANQPILAASSVRGMLRSAYEAVTNSRLGVFPTDTESGHQRFLGFRPNASSGLATVPVRLERIGGLLRARLLPGTTPFGKDGRAAPGKPVFAACVAMFSQAWTMPNADQVQHGRACWAFISPWRHERFSFWNVETISLSEGCPETVPDPSRYRPLRRTAGPAPWEQPRWVKGWLCVTERNIDGKHDERFFFDLGEPRYASFDDAVVGNWSRLIEDYQNQHEEELSRGIKRPPALKDFCRFSRHITHDLKQVASEERELRDGTLAYASVEQTGTGHIATALYPVMISRKLFARSPLDLLPATTKLRPATQRSELSPADRVFGWVSQDSDTGQDPAHKSQLRVGVVKCVTPKAVETFAAPKILAILGQPKPAQGRFYVGKEDGSAQEKGGSKEDRGYSGKNRLRGPKVFPHHRQGVTAAAFSGEESNQNRSITGWVKPKVSFEFTLHVVNLTRFELGALVWLLSQDEGHFLRLGLGKPLGFGSVRAEFVADGTVLAESQAWIDCIGTTGRPTTIDPGPLKAEFDVAMVAANPKLLESFKRAATGFETHPIHYPRLDTQGAGDREHFEWFVANEREGKRDPGQKVALRDLWADCSLPSNPAIP